MTDPTPRLTRRTAAALLLIGATAPSLAWGQVSPPGGRLLFEIWRNGQKIGTHQVTFHGGPDDLQVDTDAHMLIKLGPLPVFNYRFRSTERWRAGRFVELESHSTTNGKIEQVRTHRTEGGLTLDLGARTLSIPSDAAPLSHWNPKAFGAPLFNPQTGELLKVSVHRGEDPAFALPTGKTIRTTSYTLAGTADLTDWYDPAGVWTGLKGKVKDGSYIEYRRV
jgi:hypothetical protein